mgnify:FL=1
MEFNVTQHAIMRYLQRKLGETIVNDRTFETWKKTNECSEQLIKEAIVAIKKIVLNSELELDGDFNSKKQPTKYFINTEAVCISCVKEQNIVTLYELKFEPYYSQETNRSILKTLLAEYKTKELSVKEKERIMKELKIKNSLETDFLNEEVKKKKTELQILEERLKIVTSETTITTKEWENSNVVLEQIKAKICKSEF